MGKYSILLSLGLVFCLCACGSAAQPETSAALPSQEQTASVGFETILDDYCLAYTKKWSGYEMREAQVACFKTQEDGASIDDFGFSVMDVNGDGYTELIIGLLDGTSEDPLCGFYYDIEGDCGAYGVSYTDDYEDTDGMYPSFVRYYAVLNEDSGSFDLLKVTKADGSDESMDGGDESTDGEGTGTEGQEEKAMSLAYELDVVTEGCMSMQEELIPNGEHTDSSIGWVMNKEDASNHSSEEAWTSEELTEEEAQSLIDGWMANALTPDYHPLTDWVENPVLEEYVE